MALESVKETLYEHLNAGDADIDSEWVDVCIEQARRRPDQIRDQAANFGTEAHILIEQIIQGLEPEIPQNMEAVVQGFTDWRRDANLETRTETPILPKSSFS